jgi:hypothetical protein
LRAKANRSVTVVRVRGGVSVVLRVGVAQRRVSGRRTAEEEKS